jgi:hypothetical protein
VPSLSVRSDELPALSHAIVEEIKTEYARWLRLTLGTGAAASAEAGAESTLPPVAGLDRERLMTDGKRVADFVLGTQLVERLRTIPWERHGELRGLAQTLRRLLLGADFPEALDATEPEASLAVSVDRGRRLLDAVLSLTGDERSTLTKAVNRVEKAHRLALVDLLHRDVVVRAALAEKLGLDPAQITQHLADFKRRAKSPSSDSDSANLGGMSE